MAEQAVPRFTSDSLGVIVAHLRSVLDRGAAVVSIEVPDPDLGRGRYPGEALEGLVHRPLRAWCDLAEGLGCRLLTPQAVSETHVALRFERLGEEAEWHSKSRADIDVRERYGSDSEFARVRKLEDPGFLLPWLEALGRISLPSGARVLDLGVNRGDELEALARLAPADSTFVGIDHSPSAIAAARARFPSDRFELIEADLNSLPGDLGRFDLIVSVGTLQSPGIDDRALLRRLVQQHLADDSALLLGFPNSRFRDGEVVFGARVLNLREPDLSLLVRDLAFYQRYLRQHGFRTFLGGKYDLLLSGLRRRSP